MSMKRIEAFVELLYEEKIQDEFDRVIPIVADESMGKSTFILQFMVLWKRITDQEINVDDLLDQLVYQRQEFKDAMASYPPRTVIAVPDAARVFFKKDSMDVEQKELEKDMLDVRTKEHPILLGFQDYDIIPTFLQKRRAKNLIYIPTRGQIWAYNRDTMDERYEQDSWPSPDMDAQFPSLEGTDLWRQYKRLDKQKKQERIADSSFESEDKSVREVVDQIKDDGIDSVTSIHGGWNRKIIDTDMIRHRYDLSHADAKTAKKLLEKDDEVELGD